MATQKNNKPIKLPDLPYGEGSMSTRPDGTIMYRKRIGNPKSSIPYMEIRLKYAWKNAKKRA